MRMWQLCPLCHGEGYTPPFYFMSSSTEKVVCRICFGVGMILTPESPSILPPTYITLPEKKVDRYIDGNGNEVSWAYFKNDPNDPKDEGITWSYTAQNNAKS